MMKAGIFEAMHNSQSTLTTKPFYFLRHGETDWNKERKWQGSQDIPLNDTGIAQALHRPRQSARCLTLWASKRSALALCTEQSRLQTWQQGIWPLQLILLKICEKLVLARMREAITTSIHGTMDGRKALI